MSCSSRNFLSACVLLLAVFIAAGCISDKDDVLPVYTAYKFDNKVMEKLPLYDSLASAITAKLPVFQKYIDKEEGYQAFRFMPSAYETGIFRVLPAEAGTDITRYYDSLGKDFIFGFDVFKDSSIKIYIRSTPAAKKLVDIEENLSYYPGGTNIKHREFPVKDSMLNNHWQYWTRFNKQDLF